MPVSPKALLLDALPSTRLRELADHLEVNGSRQSKAELIEAFTRYRRLSAERICELLSVDEHIEKIQRRGRKSVTGAP